MSDDRITRVSVRVLDRRIPGPCPAEELSDLLDSAEYLDSKMREVRDSGKVVGLPDRGDLGAQPRQRADQLRRNGGTLDGDLGHTAAQHARACESALKKGQH